MAKTKQLSVFLIAFLVVAAGFAVVDVTSLGTTPQAESDAIAQATSAKWLEENESKVMKGLQSALFGTGVWFRSMDAESYVPSGIETPEGVNHLRRTVFEINHEKIAGKLVMLVDLRTSHVGRVEPSVIAADLVGIASLDKPDDGSDEAVFSADALTFGRIYFYLTGFSSLIWQMVVVGVIFGLVRTLFGRSSRSAGVGVAVIISALITITATALLSKLEPAFMVGSAALVVFCAAWWATSHEARANLARETS